MWHVEKTRELQERQIAESKCSKDVVELRDGNKTGNWTRESCFVSEGNWVSFFSFCVRCVSSQPEEEEVDAAEAAALSRRPP